MNKRRPMSHLFQRLTALERAGLGRKRTTTRKRSKKPAAHATRLRTVLLGSPVELVYHHAQGGKYSHKFPKGARVSYTPDGRHLVIDGIDVRAFIS